MATMGVRWNQGVGSSGSSELADVLSKAIFGDADALREDALARSRLQNDEYTRRQIESATQWNQIRADRDAAELAAQQGAAPVFSSVMQQFLNRPTATPAPGTPGVEYSTTQNWPAPVQIGTTDIPTPTPRPNIEAEGWPAPVEVPAMEPDYSFSTYPQRSDLLPQQAPIPQPVPVMGEPNLDAALMRRQPPATTGFLAPYGPEAATELSGLPDELQPVAVGEPSPPEPRAEDYQIAKTLVPGRPTVETREVQGPPVPVEVDPAGPPTATGDFLPEGAPAPVDQALPGSPIMADVQGPPMPVPVGQVKVNADGTSTMGTPKGDVIITKEQADKLGSLIAFSTDPGKQQSAITGNIDIMNRGPTMEGVTLRDGIPSRESVLGTAEQIKVNDAKAASDAKYAEPDLKKRVQVVENIPYEIFEGPDGAIHSKMVAGFAAPDAPALPGESPEIVKLNKLLEYTKRANRGETLSPEEHIDYGVIWDSLYKPTTTSQVLPGGGLIAQTPIKEPPDDLRRPDNLTPGPPVPATAPPAVPPSSTQAPAPAAPAAAPPAPPQPAAPAAPAAPVMADQLAADQPAIPGPPVRVKTVDGQDVEVFNYGGWNAPGSTPPVDRTEVAVPGGRVVTTEYGDRSNNIKLDGDTSNRVGHLWEGIPAMRYLDDIKPGMEPSGFQEALEQWSATGISEALLANPNLDPETRMYGNAIRAFINGPKRTQSGAAIQPQEVEEFRRLYSMPPGASNQEYWAARDRRTAYLGGARFALNGQAPGNILQGIDKRLAEYGIDLNYKSPNLRGGGQPAATEAPAETIMVEDPPGSGNWRPE